MKGKHRGGISRNRLLRELKRVGEAAERAPTTGDMAELGEFSVATYYNAFESWNDAVRAAGYEPRRERDVSGERLLNELRRVGEVVDRAPSIADMRERGRYSPNTLRHRFGSWNRAVEEAGFDPRGGTLDGEPVGDYGPNWEDQRERALIRDNYRCQECGTTAEEHYERHGMELHVHHIRPAREFTDAERRNALENLVTLCTVCHGRKRD